MWKTTSRLTSGYQVHPREHTRGFFLCFVTSLNIDGTLLGKLYKLYKPSEVFSFSEYLLHIQVTRMLAVSVFY